ncbi:hypothetical protein [Priestia aryabhattai]|uniref:hypothetical protein n=1 Tax=Priestia aryabhattai TaxID=412384 RepID=UPI001ADB6921|nr:hypothetical protein [Priestia aryabhattai]QTL51430.1 hypothetical protein J5Z55_10290 [Priestia aryabhattai]
MFNYDDLNRTLASFYRYILHEKYNININSTNGLRNYFSSIKSSQKASLVSENPKGSIQTLMNTGDLRHIAIINMMMQGYDKVEIQRLAGHITEDTQYGYYNHMGSWMDTEIKKIEVNLAKYQTSSFSFNKETELAMPPTIKEFFEKQNINNYINVNIEKSVERDYVKLDLGHCTDKSMPCPSVNWKHTGCYFCEKWYISPEELEEKRSLVTNDLYLLYKETKDRANFIKNIFQKQFRDDYNQYFSSKNDLSSTAKEIQEGIRKIAKLKSMLGVGDIEQEWN